MAICKLNNNLLRATSCSYTLNDIVALYLVNFEDVSATTVSTCGGTGTTGQEVSSITLASGAETFVIYPAKNTGAFSDSLTVLDNGAKYRVHSVTFSFNGMYDCNMVDVVDALSLGKYVAVVATAGGEYIMLGRTAGLEADTVQFGGEAGVDNAAGLEVTLTGNAAEAMLPCTAGVVTTIKGALHED